MVGDERGPRRGELDLERPPVVGIRHARDEPLLDDRLTRAAHAFRPAEATLSAADRRELLALLRRMTDALRKAS